MDIRSFFKEPPPKQQKISDESHQVPEATECTPESVSGECAASGMSCQTEQLSNPSDIGNIVDKSGLTDYEIHEYLLNHWKPTAKYNFPKTLMRGKSRSFVYNWLDKFPWLAYSPKFDGAFCAPCVLFGKVCGKNSTKLTRLYTSPLTDWSSSLKRFREHESCSDVHKSAVVFADNFKKRIDEKTPSVIELANIGIAKTIQTNRQKLHSILSAIVFCGKQNIPLRGHMDDDTDLDNIDTVNCGNFQALLQFRVDTGDVVLKEHFDNAGKNTRYRSKTIQNELIDACRQHITEEIVNRVKKAKYFAVMADEGTDISNKSQLPIVIRNYDVEQEEIREDFVSFIHLEEGTSGEVVANAIKNTVRAIGLDMPMCRGQCYDGAGNMAGKIKGSASVIKRDYPNAHYIHCRSHVLNLCVVKSCSNQFIRNMMDTLGEVARFFDVHPQRNEILKAKISELCPESKTQKLIDVCRTRWLERLDALDCIVELLEPVTAALDQMRLGKYCTETVTKANGLYHRIQNGEFIISICICKELLAYTRGLTTKLQSRSLEMFMAYNDVRAVISTLEGVRADITAKHHAYFENASNLASSIQGTIRAPRVCGRQIHRTNIVAETAEDYFRCAITVPFLDHLVQELHTRFMEGQEDIVPKSTFLLPSQMRSASHWKEEILLFARNYMDDIPTPTSLSAELDLWETKWVGAEKLPDTALETLSCTDPVMFPNITTCLILSLTTPVTSCECERSVSALRRLKTYMRSTMTNLRLNGLALLHCHYSMQLNFNRILDIFVLQHPRRLQMSNILDS